jgi:ABC-type uncharacterized transport system involved in gliding motility auxiliary subunit
MKQLAPYAQYVFWAGVAVLALTLIVLLGGGRGPIPTEYMAVVGVALVVLSGVLNPVAVQQLVGVRSVRYGGNALLITVAFLVILGLVNYLATRPSFNYRKDFTANQQFSLSPQTIQILEKLKEPMKATGFFSIDAPGKQEAQDRLREYKLRSQGKLDYELVDPDVRPDLAQQLGATHDGGIVFQLGNKKQEAISSSESDFTSAIVKLTTDKPRVAYFVTGHKEHGLDEFGDSGYSSVKAWLEKDNYSLATINTIITQTIPTSATVLILASPAITLTEGELFGIDAYLMQGGRLLVLSDPTRPEPLPGVLDKWGVKFNNDIVIEPDPNLSVQRSALYPVVVQYQFSSITQQLNGRPTVFPVARSLKRGDGAAPDLVIQSVAQASPSSWGETNLDFSAQPRYEEGKDNKGPVDLMVSVEGNLSLPGLIATRKTRIVVVGTSQLVANNILQNPSLRGAANIDMFMNAVNWLAEEESLISIRPTQPDSRFITMTDGQARLVALITLLVMPGLMFLAGIGVWWRRR